MNIYLMGNYLQNVPNKNHNYVYRMIHFSYEEHDHVVGNRDKNFFVVN